ncbi:hypothetical protein CG51_02065 [Haematobacter missouriensis]|uniref:Uncharacterized protein n=1 Tax=Haematobacter missouriensis TaxID=366616 RepID=A0A212ALF6_9RHOB|nr:hypothetical protein CG51_02065 [Haematobacter missouriensis]OWJ76434.1 hypothetical protein CDV53_07835 [Haematobacter missouriensis]OWJ82295.1 hypothetical protein CDV52_15315 [Haematobacter missouriensis]
MGRDALSILFSMVVYAGYGLLLTAAMALSESGKKALGRLRQDKLENGETYVTGDRNGRRRRFFLKVAGQKRRHRARQPRVLRLE